MSEQFHPSGPSEPAEEQVRRWIEDPTGFWEECRDLYGSVVSLQLGSLGPVLLISEPALVAEVFRLPADSFEVRPYNEHYRHVMGSEAVLVSDGATHHRQRRVITPPVQTESVVAPHVPAIRAVAREILDLWPAGEPFNPRPWFHLLTFTVMIEFLLGSRTSTAARSLITLYRSEVASRPGSWGPWRRFSLLHPRIAELLSDEIELRKADSGTRGLLTHLVHAAGPESGGSHDEIMSHVFTFLIAGVDTTAISLSWSLYWLSREREVREKLVQDLAAPGDGPDSGLLEKPWLDAVFRETVRMYPVVPTPSGRRLTREVRLGTHLVPAGTTLVPCPYLVHRDADIFPEPESFRPARFLNRRYAPHEYFPFGGGVRACVGRTFAPIEFKVVLSTLFARWDLGDWSGPPIRPARHGILLAPSDDFRIVVRPLAVTSEKMDTHRA